MYIPDKKKENIKHQPAPRRCEILWYEKHTAVIHKSNIMSVTRVVPPPSRVSRRVVPTLTLV